MVRRAAAHNLGNFSKVVGANSDKKLLVDDIMPLLNKLALDDQDSVRLLAIENCAAMCGLLTEEENAEFVLPIVRASVEDRSWRVRFNVAKEFHALAKAMGAQITETDLLPSFCNLLQDAEAEVRTVAAKNIQGFQELSTEEVFVAELVPIMQVLAQDTVQNVRVALAEACMGIAPKLAEETFMTYIVPLLMHFLRDEAPEVRLNVLSRLSDLSSWIEALSTSLLPVVMELREDSQWRVRQSIASILPTIAQKMGANYFQQNMQDIFFSGFSDEVAAVRMATSNAMGLLLEFLGAETLAQTFVPKLNELWHDASTTYFVKINILFACKALGDAQSTAKAGAGSGQLMTAIKNLCVKGLGDDVCNVQFTAAEALASVAPAVSDAERVEVKGELEKLAGHADTEVIFFVGEALAKCE